MKLNEVPMSDALSAAELPPQAICEEVLLEKYAKGGERTVDEVRRRVARALAAVERPEAAVAVGGAFPQSAVRRAHSRRSDQFRGGDRAQGDADQLLRAAGRRFDFERWR